MSANDLQSARARGLPDDQVLDDQVLIVGAGPAGLAVGACLRREGVPFLILEKESEIAPSWRRHYDRLHLHTDKARSALPYQPFPREYPRYPSRDQVVAYLEEYARRFELRPRLGEEVVSMRREGGSWAVRTASRLYRSRWVVVASGHNRKPVMPDWPGTRDFTGEIVHARDYRNGERFRGKRVLVVGMGNSGAEIALDLHEHGARPVLAVRGPLNAIPRELLGIPFLAIAIPLSRLPASLADLLTAPVRRAIYRDLYRLGLRRSADGPFVQVASRQRIPLIDVGTLELIERGEIEVRGDVAGFDDRYVRFDDGGLEAVDAVVVATGYAPGLDEFLEEPVGRGGPPPSGRPLDEENLPGLYLCGFEVVPTGMLREIGLEAGRIARDISSKRRQGSSSSEMLELP